MSIKVTCSGGATFEGKVLCVDPVTSSVVLQDEEGYRLINGSHITRMEGDLAAIQPNGTVGGRGPKVDVNQLEKKEQESLGEANRRLESVNTSVSDEVQNLFINLKTVLTDVTWSGKDIRLMADFVIHPPYSAVELLEGPAVREVSGSENHLKLQAILARQMSKKVLKPP